MELKQINQETVHNSWLQSEFFQFLLIFFLKLLRINANVNFVLKEKINGINSPYLYVGSIFSPFGFHLEDGNLYSINFMHSGEVKVW